MKSARTIFASQRGMTLVEIMVVIAIIGTIATVVAVNVFGIFSQSNVQNTKLQMGTMHEALGIYKITHGQKYPRMGAILMMFGQN